MQKSFVIQLLAAGFLGSTAFASPTLYSFSADIRPIVGTGAPTSLNSMDPASQASVSTVQNPVGAGDIGFNAGLVGVGGALYGIGNDSFGQASLYSMGLTGLNLLSISSNFNVGGDADQNVFQNGLTAIGNTFYAIGVDGTGTESLFQIGNGTATELRTLPTFGGTYSGLTYDFDTGAFLGVIVNSTNTDFAGDLLVQFLAGSGFGVRARLNALDGAQVGTHLGGIVYAGGNIAYSIFTDPNTQTGQLEQLTLGPPVTASVLYDTGVPLMEDHGIAIGAVPEPGSATAMLFGGALLVAIGRRRPRNPRA